jgi:hypothetical protein
MNKDELMEAIKGVAQEGADISAIELGLTGLNPLSGVSDKDQAMQLIKDNPYLNSAYDSGISKGVESYKERFNKEKLPELISAERQKLISEFNPEETEAQKVAREFAEYKQAQETKEHKATLRTELITTFDKIKAVDNGFKAEDLQYFVDMGDKGVEQFVKMNERIGQITKSKIELALKGKYTTEQPQAGEQQSNYDLNGRMGEALSFMNR